MNINEMINQVCLFGAPTFSAIATVIALSGETCKKQHIEFNRNPLSLIIQIKNKLTTIGRISVIFGLMAAGMTAGSLWLEEQQKELEKQQKAIELSKKEQRIKEKDKALQKSTADLEMLSKVIKELENTDNAGRERIIKNITKSGTDIYTITKNAQEEFGKKYVAINDATKILDGKITTIKEIADATKTNAESANQEAKAAHEHALTGVTEIKNSEYGLNRIRTIANDNRETLTSVPKKTDINMLKTDLTQTIEKNRYDDTKLKEQIKGLEQAITKLKEVPPASSTPASQPPRTTP